MNASLNPLAAGARRITAGVAGGLACLYVLACATLFVAQRGLIFPRPPPTPVQVQGATLLTLPRSDAPPAWALWLPPPEGAPVVVLFHGNAEDLAGVGDLVHAFAAAGLGVLVVEFPGYGPAYAESPSEDGCYAAAEAALVYLQHDLGVPADRTVLVGRSLGSGVAAEMAARRHGARLVLVSPYTSIPDVGARLFPWLPVRLLARDRFATAAKATQLRLPTLVVHGTADRVIPYEMGVAVSHRIVGARLVTVPDGDHDGSWLRPSVWAEIVAFALGM